jgi:hypothetical protein
MYIKAIKTSLNISTYPQIMALFFPPFPPPGPLLCVWGKVFSTGLKSKSLRVKTQNSPHKTHHVQNKGSFHKMRLLLFNVVQALMGRKFST